MKFGHGRIISQLISLHNFWESHIIFVDYVLLITLISRVSSNFKVSSFMTEALSCRNQSIDLLCKSMDWFIYNRDLHYERVKYKVVWKKNIISNIAFLTNHNFEKGTSSHHWILLGRHPFSDVFKREGEHREEMG